MTPQTVAEAIEQARLALLRQGTWAELRESERTTRVQVMLAALEASGVATQLERFGDASAEVAALEAELRSLRARAAIREAELTAEVDRLGEALAAFEAGAEPRPAAEPRGLLRRRLPARR